jgi:hypothetical protein
MQPEQIQPDEAWAFVGKKTRLANLGGDSDFRVG